MQGNVAARAIDLLHGEKIVPEHPAVAAARTVDDDDVGRKAGDPGQALPIDVGSEANLVGEGGALPGAAADISSELGDRVELQIDTASRKVR